MKFLNDAGARGAWIRTLLRALFRRASSPGQRPPVQGFGLLVHSARER